MSNESDRRQRAQNNLKTATKRLRDAEDVKNRTPSSRRDYPAACTLVEQCKAAKEAAETELKLAQAAEDAAKSS